jgi:hypothetical protein
VFGRDDPPPLRLEEAKLQGGCFWGKDEEQAAEVVWKRMPVNVNVEEVRVRNNAWGEGEYWVQLHDCGERAGGD